MSELKLEGKLIVKNDTQQVTDTFKKREFVIETEGDYPQSIKFELKQDNCSKLDAYKVGDMIAVSFNVDGRPWVNKEGKTVYFVSLSVWRIEKVGSVTAPVDKYQDVPVVDNDIELPF